MKKSEWGSLMSVSIRWSAGEDDHPQVHARKSTLNASDLSRSSGKGIRSTQAASRQAGWEKMTR
jgi:hypothetical protein